MEKEEVASAAIPASSDCKRKHDDLESDAPDPPSNGNETDSVRRDEGIKEDNGAAVGVGSDESEAKRPRLDENSDGLGLTENGFQEGKVENAELPSVEKNTVSEHAQELANEAPDNENNNLPCDDDQPKVEIQPSSVADIQLESAQPQPPSSLCEHQEPSAEVPQQGDVYPEEQQPAVEISRKMEIPHNKVGVLIGKAGDTIRLLQSSSGAKIQITRDVDTDFYSPTRRAELVGTLENINKAERLIKDVIAEADAGGSPSLAARGFSNVYSSGAAEQIHIQIPNEKVGMIIGKSGETIKNLQTRSGARIQLVPQHLPEGDQSKERTVRVSGDKKQIEIAREMIKEVTNQTPRSSSSRSGGYNHHHHHQGYRPRGPSHHRGPHPSQSSGYNYHQRGSYPPQNQNSQYGPPPYGGSNYPPQQMGYSRSGWEQRPPPQQGGGGYDYYGGHMGDVQASYHGGHGGHGPSPTPSQGNYNYNYGQQPQAAAAAPPPYSSQAPQSYGYNEAKYENQSYPGGGSQPHPGYAAPPQDQQYGKAAPPSYPQQQYGVPPRGTQPGDNMSYHAGPVSVQPTQQQYAPPPQTQTYPQTYPQSYGGSDGYNVNQHQMQPVAPGSVAAPVYPQQGSVSGYGQPQQQQGYSGYAQMGPPGSYVSYPPGYTEQSTAQNTAAAAAVYGGYQGAVDPAAAYASAPPPTGYAQPTPTQPPTGYAQPAPTQPPTGYAQPAPTQQPTGQAGYAKPAPTQPPTGQTGYAQPAPTQPPTGYDHSGSYGNAPVAYGKSS